MARRRTPHRRGRALQRHHRRARPAHPAAVGGPDDPGPGPGLRDRRGGRGDLRARSCCRRRWCSSAAGCSGRASRTSATPALVETDSLWHRVGDPGRAPSRGLRHRHAGACSRSWRSGVFRIDDRPRPGRPVPRQSPRRSPPRSGWPSRSRPGVTDPAQVLTRDDADAVLDRGGGRGRRPDRADQPAGRRDRPDRRRARGDARAATSRRDTVLAAARRRSPPSTTPTSAAPRRPRSTQRESAQRDRLVILPLILALVLGALLLLLLRSVVAPLLLVATVRGDVRREHGHRRGGSSPGCSASRRSTRGCRCWRSCSSWRSASTTTSSW